jgi:hypothetical protein
MVSKERGIHLMCVCVRKEEYKYRIYPQAWCFH